MRLSTRQRPISRPRKRCLHLLLALLLALAPLLSGAQPLISDAEAGAGEPTTTQMPCHSHAGGDHVHMPTADAGDCPHCSGDAPLDQCDCCEQAVPAAVAVYAPTGGDTCADTRPRMSYTRFLPRSPGERIYRPPIRSL